MNRILDFSPSQEEAVVSRILVLVHQAIDEAFPSTENANRRFTKTVFSEEGGEKTAALRPPGEFGNVEDTSPDGRNAEGQLPPPPPARVPPPPPPPSRPRAQQTESSTEKGAPPPASSPHVVTKGASRTTRLDTHMEKMGVAEGPDWVTRITLALLIAGVLLLAYVMFA